MWVFLLWKSYCFMILFVIYVPASSLEMWVSIWMIQAFHLGVNTDVCKSLCRLCVSRVSRTPACSARIPATLVCVVGFRQQLLKQYLWLWVYPGLPSSWPTCQVDIEHVARCAWSIKSLMSQGIQELTGRGHSSWLLVCSCIGIVRDFKRKHLGFGLVPWIFHQFLRS